MTVDDMRNLVKKHADLEAKLDLEGVLSTLVDSPIYEFHPDRLRLEGKENIRQFYQDHFDCFFPLIKSNVLINESWDAHSACLEYDLYLKAPHDPDRAYRISVVLTEENSLLIGERFYVENELARLMAGASFNKFIKF
jgi:ketosteroid isomerase-like protein